MSRLLVRTFVQITLIFASVIGSSCSAPAHIDNLKTDVPALIPTATVTPIPCAYPPPQPTTELQKTAETWFLSDIPQIPARNQYKLFSPGEEWGSYCERYQFLLSTNKQLASNPIEISLRIITRTLGGENYFGMNNVVAVAVNSDDWLVNKDLSFSSPKNKDIMIVVVTFPYTDNLVESRTDYVFENGLWQFRWLGVRWKCLNDTEANWNIQESGDCSK